MISVIVPVWNRPDDIRRCIESLERQTLSRAQYEVIVVDNGSTDATPDVVREYGGVHLLEEQRPGSYAARNSGLAQATGEFVAFIDSDCRAEPTWLEESLRAARENADAGVIAGRVELERDEKPISPVCDAHERVFAFNQQENVRKRSSVTANWLSPTRVIREFGGFRADLKSGGDFELSRRISDAGYPIVYAPEMLVIHPARATFAELAAKKRRVIGGRMTTMKRKGGALGWIYGQVVTTAHNIKKVAQADSIGWWMKVKLSGLLIALLGVGIAEIIRLARGAEARRS